VWIGQLDNDHNAMKKLVKSGEILDEVEKVVGSWDRFHMSLQAVGEAISCNQEYTKLEEIASGFVLATTWLYWRYHDPQRS